MALSSFLKSRRKKMVELVRMLSTHFHYASILGVDTVAKQLSTNKNQKMIREAMDTDRGFVVKVNDGRSFYEYSFDDIKNVDKVYQEVKQAFGNFDKLEELMIHAKLNEKEYLKKDFERRSDYAKYSDDMILEVLDKIKDETLGKSKNLLNVYASLQMVDTNKLFVSTDRELSQHFTWTNGNLVGVYRGEDGKIVNTYEGSYSNKIKDVLEDMPKHIDNLVDTLKHLALAKPVEPGIYDIITHPSISGLIAHEAFGHGVEMDQFTKKRALAERYVGDYVASPIVNMKDGAASAFSVASYFFDDDGVLAHDTDIIQNGILVRGISDLVSANILGTEPTGNGRRESHQRKAYTRMTNTFFLPGKDKVEDMIKSVKHGYMLFNTNNGMEDPKNWGIQCTAEYGIEIVDGKLTENYVSPVVISGYVPDLLKSITMVSDKLMVIGSGGCGKGYKEWVRVSDGGPYLKGRVKLS